MHTAKCTGSATKTLTRMRTAGVPAADTPFPGQRSPEASRSAGAVVLDPDTDQGPPGRVRAGSVLSRGDLLDDDTGRLAAVPSGDRAGAMREEQVAGLIRSHSALLAG